jgi:hypothetical protein
VTIHNNVRIIAADICRVWTTLSGGRNLVLVTIGPPKNDSITEGTCTSGIASLGISLLPFIFPAAFFLLGADDLIVFPSYK